MLYLKKTSSPLLLYPQPLQIILFQTVMIMLPNSNFFFPQISTSNPPTHQLVHTQSHLHTSHSSSLPAISHSPRLLSPPASRITSCPASFPHQTLHESSPLVENTSSLSLSTHLSSPHVSATPSNTHLMVTRAKNNITKPRVFTDGSTRYPLPSALLGAVDLTITEPTCYTQVATDAMNFEFDALLDNNTW